MLLVFQSCMCSVRLALFLDIMGGFIMIILIGFGWYAWKQDMNLQFICYWGMMCLINGAFDFVRWIDQSVHSPLPVFSSQLGAYFNFISFLNLMIPISVLLGAPLAYRLY